MQHLWGFMEQETETKKKPFKLNMSIVGDNLDVEYEGDEVYFQQLLDTLDTLNKRKCEEREKKERQQNQTDVILNVGLICLMLLGVFMVTTMITTVINSIGVEDVRK